MVIAPLIAFYGKEAELSSFEAYFQARKKKIEQKHEATRQIHIVAILWIYIILERIHLLQVIWGEKKTQTAALMRH